MKTFNVTTFDVSKYDEILSRGLSKGLGSRDDKMCIEAAICTVLGLPHGDDPKCVASSVRDFKIVLNDSAWSSEKARAAGLRDLGLAQLGSLGVVKDSEFTIRLSKKIIQVLIPKLFREVFPDNPVCLQAAERCEYEGSAASANAAFYAAYAANAAYAASAAADAVVDAAYAAVDAAYAVYAVVDAAYAVYAAASAADAASSFDVFLNLAAKLNLETLQELKSPGCQLLKVSGGMK